MTTPTADPSRGDRSAAPLVLTDVFRLRLRTVETLTSLSPLKVFQLCGTVSIQGAINILRGDARETSRSLAAVNQVAAIVGCPHDEAVAGRALPSVPPDVTGVVLDSLAEQVPSPFVRAFVIRRKCALGLSGGADAAR